MLSKISSNALCEPFFTTPLYTAGYQRRANSFSVDTSKLR